MTHELFTSMLLYLIVSVGFSRNFSVIDFSFILLCSENILCMILIILYFWTLVLWPGRWFILVISFENNLYSAIIVWNVL